MGPQLYRCGNDAPVPCLVPRRSASMGPQLYRCGNVDADGPPWPHIWLLQWGRNFIVAETWTARSTAIGAGTSFIGAATLSLRKPAAPSIRHSVKRRFNGAATLSLRKLTSFLIGSYGLDVLQWGRNFIVAETGGRHRRLHQGTGASMGPQLYRCGNLHPFLSDHTAC